MNVKPKPDISFRPNGRIDITSRVVKMLGLNDNDVINIESVGDEHYLYVAKKNTALNFPSKCKLEGRFARAWSVGLTDEVIRICGKKQAHLNVGEPTYVDNIGLAVPLITRNNLYEQ